MSAPTAIIDYGMGNLKSVAKAFEHIGSSVVVTSDPKTISNAARLVLPGVGAFGQCLANLKQRGLIEIIRGAIKSGKPFLGICLGLQLLFASSEESPGCDGIGILAGPVVRFKETALKIPHMGWNQIHIKKPSPLFKDIADGANFYFVHSYYVCPQQGDVIAATTEYQEEFCSAIEQDNIFACQFHPEKSQRDGLKLLENFSRL